MADAASLVARVTADTSAAEATLGKFGSSLGGVAKNMTGLLAGAAVAGGVAVAGGLGLAVKSAADFQSQISGIAAVGGAEASARMSEISAKALQVGKDTSFSASEAAAGMQELMKAGVSLDNVLGPATDATVALAAATGINLAGAAEIASNAMNQFGLAGNEIGSVADIVAGAANASAIDVNDFKFSLASAGAVANTIGFSFKDTAVAIAALGQAGIKGSDAGTSLKTMFLNLQPITEKQVGLFRELGLATDETSSTFFDQAGKIKPMREVFGLLNTALADYTEQEKLAALETIFGSDAIRAGAIAAKLGAEGFDEMAAAMDKVTAADVAKTRLNNLNGSIEALKGSLETAGIIIGTAFLPVLQSIVKSATEVLNANMPLIEQFATDIPNAIATVGQVMAGDWSSSANISPLVNSIGEIAIVARDQVLPALGQLFGFLQANIGTIAAAAAGFAAFGIIVTIGSAIAGVVATVSGMVAAFSAASAGIAGFGGVVAGIVAVLGGPVTLAIAGIAAAIALLTAAWVGNWGDIQGKTAAAWGTIEPILAAMGKAFGMIGEAFDLGGVSGALDELSRLLTEGLNLLAPLAMQALAPVGEAIGGFFAGLGESIGGQFDALGTMIHSSLAATGASVQADFATMGTNALALVEQMHAGITAIWNLIPEDIRVDLELIGSIMATNFAANLAAAIVWGQSTLASIAASWAEITASIGAAWTEITSTITTALSGLLSAIGAWIADTVGQFTAWATELGAQATAAGTNLTTPITSAIAEILGAIGAWVGQVVGLIQGLAGEAGAAAAQVGRDIVQGLGNGLAGGMGWIGQQAANLARAAINSAKAVLEERSPSQVFYDIGKNVTVGLVQGIESGRGDVSDVMRTIIDTAIRHGIDPMIALALAKAESNFNPGAVGDAGASVGLFQLHERGQGAGMSKAQRSDPSTNAEKFLSQHGALFAQLKATGLAGEELAKTFGRLAEGSDPQHAHRYAEAYRELAAQFGGTDLAAKGTSAAVTSLGAVQKDSGAWAKTMADQQAALTQVMNSQAPAAVSTKDAMSAFGAVLGPIERQVAGGAIGMSTLQFKMVDLARATGIATEPWDRYAAGTITVDEAMKQVINSAADASPQFDQLRKDINAGSITMDEATLRFLQLGLGVAALPAQITGPITTATGTMNTALAGTGAVAVATQDQISTVFQTLLTQISTTLTGMAAQMQTNWAAMLAGSQTAWQNMVAAIQTATALTISTIAVMVQTVMGLTAEQTQAVVGKSLEMSAGVLAQIQAMAGGSVSATQAMATAETAAAAAAAAGVVSQATTMQTGAVGQAETMAGGVGQSFDVMKIGAAASMEELSATILGGLSELESSASDAARAVGAGVGEGVADGMRSALSSIQSAANAIVDEVDAALRAKAQIQSPSHLFAWHGQMMARGVMDGMTDELRGFDVALPALRGGRAGGYGDNGDGGGGQLSIDYARLGREVAQAMDGRGESVTVNGAGTEEVVAYLQRRVRRNQLLRPRRTGR